MKPQGKLFKAISNYGDGSLNAKSITNFVSESDCYGDNDKRAKAANIQGNTWCIATRVNPGYNKMIYNKAFIP